MKKQDLLILSLVVVLVFGILFSAVFSGYGYRNYIGHGNHHMAYNYESMNSYRYMNSMHNSIHRSYGNYRHNFGNYGGGFRMH